MIAHDLASGRWYFVAVHYPTAKMAKDAWEQVERFRKTRIEAVGVVRMGSVQPRPGTIPSGAPAGTNPVIAFTTEKSLAGQLERMLRSGASWVPTDSLMDGLIYRMARALSGGRTQYHLRRPDAYGATVDRLGNVREPPRQG